MACGTRLSLFLFFPVFGSKCPLLDRAIFSRFVNESVGQSLAPRLCLGWFIVLNPYRLPTVPGHIGLCRYVTYEEGAERAARHGAVASSQEQEGDRGAYRQGHDAKLKADRRRIGRASPSIGAPNALAELTRPQYSHIDAISPSAARGKAQARGASSNNLERD